MQPIHFVLIAPQLVKYQNQWSSGEISLSKICKDLFAIDVERFNKISTLALKQEYLRYRFLRTEFDLLVELKNQSDLPNEIIQPNLAAFFAFLDEVYAHVRLELLADHVDRYGKHSLGLTQLDIRPPEEVGKSAEASESTSSSLTRSVMQIDEKKGGIEPGFQAVLMQDILLHIDNQTGGLRDQRIEKLKSFDFDREKLIAAFKEHVPQYLVKLTYDELSNGKVVPEAVNIKRTSTVQAAYKTNRLFGLAVEKVMLLAKTEELTKKNCEAFQEIIANDVARLCGMQVQDQYLMQRILHGRLQFLLVGKWVERATTFNLGGSEDKKFNNLIVRDVVAKQNGIVGLSDNSVTNVPQQLPLMLTQADNDGIGSKGQNKLRVGNRLVGIDFGHAYRKTPAEVANFIAQEITLDFQVKHPDFKNYSIFNDFNRSDIVKGLLPLAKLAGQTISPEIVQSYGDPHLQAQLDQLNPNDDLNIFDDYSNKIRALLNEYVLAKDEANFTCCEVMLATIETAKQSALAARTALLEKFKTLITLSKQDIDILENLEKLFAGKENTTLRSPSNQILLNHLRIKGQRPIITPVKGEAFTAFSLSTTREIDDKSLEFIWLKNIAQAVEGSIFTFDSKSKTITFYVKKNMLNKMLGYLNEEKIKAYFHPEDHKLAEHYILESEMILLLSSFKKYGLDLQLTADKGYLIVNNSQDASRDPLFQEALIHRNFKLHQPFAFDNLANTFALLTVVANDTEQNRKDFLDKFTKLQNEFMEFSGKQQPFFSLKIEGFNTQLILNNSDELMRVCYVKQQTRLKRFLEPNPLTTHDLLALYSYLVLFLNQYKQAQPAQVEPHPQVAANNDDDDQNNYQETEKELLFNDLRELLVLLMRGPSSWFASTTNLITSAFYSANPAEAKNVSQQINLFIEKNQFNHEAVQDILELLKKREQHIETFLLPKSIKDVSKTKDYNDELVLLKNSIRRMDAVPHLQLEEGYNGPV